jgi:hypothetical protein
MNREIDPKTRFFGELAHILDDPNVSNVARADQLIQLGGWNNQESDWAENQLDGYFNWLDDMYGEGAAEKFAPFLVAHFLARSARNDDTQVGEREGLECYKKWKTEGYTAQLSESRLDQQTNTVLENKRQAWLKNYRKVLADAVKLMDQGREYQEYERQLRVKRMVAANKSHFQNLFEAELRSQTYNNHFAVSESRSSKTRSKSSDRLPSSSMSDLQLGIGPSDSASNVSMRTAPVMSQPPQFVPAPAHPSMTPEFMAQMQAMMAFMQNNPSFNTMRNQAPEPEIKSVVVPASPVQDPNPDEVRPPATPNLSAEMETLNVHVIGEPVAATPSKRGKNKNKNK